MELSSSKLKKLLIFQNEFEKYKFSKHNTNREK